MKRTRGTNTYVPLAELIVPPKDGIFKAMSERYWIVDRERGAIIYDGFSPQCNRHRAITERLLPMYENAEIVFLERAYLAVDPSDFA